MVKKVKTYDDYTIFRLIYNDNFVYAVHKDEVKKMNRIKNSYANNAVPDKYTINAYPVIHLSVINNVVTDYDLESDKAEKVQINHLENYVVQG